MKTSYTYITDIITSITDSPLVRYRETKITQVTVTIYPATTVCRPIFCTRITDMITLITDSFLSHSAGVYFIYIFATVQILTTLWIK